MILWENGLYPAWEHRDPRKGNLEFHSGLVHPRRVWYDRGEIRVLLNCGDQVWPLAGEGEDSLPASSIKPSCCPAGSVSGG